MISMSGLDKKCATLLLALGFAACGSPSASVSKLRGSADGSLAQSSDGALLYAVSPDDGTLVVVDAKSKTVTATVAVGQAPARVIVGPDDTIYVSNRGSRSVSVIHRGQWTEASRIAVGAEPVGLALSADGSTLFVANHAAGSVEAVTLGSATPAVLWQTAVSDFPRGVAVLPDGRVYVSHYHTGLVDVLDGPSGKILKSVSANVGTVPALTAGFDSKGNATQPTFRAVGLDSIVVSHDGQRAYLAHRRERNGMISDTNFVPIVAPALTTIETSTDAPHDDAVETTQDYPPTIIFPDNRTADDSEVADPAIFAGTSGGSGGGSSYGGQVGPSGQPWTQGPVVVVEDAQGAFLFVANENSGDVTVLPTHRRSGNDAPGGIAGTITVGDGPSGLALSPDGQTLFVFNQISHSISVVSTSQGSLQETSRIEAVGTAGTLTVDALEGRRLFFSASDAVMSAPGSGVSCESCHLEGGTDSNVWQFIQGPRKTPGLLGKHAQNTSPYHWDGTEADAHALLTDTITVRMGGSGTDSTQERQVVAFMAQLRPLDNPHQVAGGLTAQQQHGQALFQSANCESCHTGADLTDNGFHDVGTRVTVNANGQPDDLCRLGLTPPTQQSSDFTGVGSTGAGQLSCPTDSPSLVALPNPGNTTGGFNTPTLLSVYFSGPYLHDGSAATLNDVIANVGGQHGAAQGLPTSDVSDLVAYLQTL